MIPFEAATSARMTFASLTITPSPTVKVKSSPFTAAATMPSVTAEDGTAPDTTWYRRMSVSAAFPSSLSRAARSTPAAVKASSVGANTVKGPSPCNVESNSAWITAATSESCIPVPCATVGISTKSAGGIRTLSMT